MIKDNHWCEKGALCSKAKKFLVHFHLCEEERYAHSSQNDIEDGKISLVCDEVATVMCAQ